MKSQLARYANWWTVYVAISSGFLFGSLEGGATPRNIKEIFIGRCWEFQQVVHPHWITTQKNCTELWNIFQEAFAYRDPCDVTETRYAKFLEASNFTIDTKDKVLYWSGPVVPLVNDFTIDARRWMTIRDTLSGYIVKNIDDWCGKNESRSDGYGMNFDSCPSWYSCSGYPARMSASQAFWRAASTALAQVVQGDVKLLLNGSSGQAFRNTSTFGECELAHLEAGRNPTMQVWLIHDIVPRTNEVRETCQNGSLLQLKSMLEAKGMKYECIDDPPDLLHYQCTDYASENKCRFASAAVKSTTSSALVLAIVITSYSASRLSLWTADVSWL